MSDRRSSFVERCARGEVAPSAIDDAVADWHAGASKVDLPTYLGMTADEYADWVRDPDALARILATRQSNRRVSAGA